MRKYTARAGGKEAKRVARRYIRYQLNLTPKAKKMLEELVEYVCMYSPETDARVSEVFQGIVTLLHNAMDELELAELPRRGAWGSVLPRISQVRSVKRSSRRFFRRHESAGANRVVGHYGRPCRFLCECRAGYSAT